MNHKSTVTQHFDDVELTHFTAMEAKCAQTVEPLKAGDKVVVLYVTTVIENRNANIPISIPLVSPMIVKKAAFGAFSSRLMDTFEENKNTKAEAAPPSSSVPTE